MLTDATLSLADCPDPLGKPPTPMLSLGHAVLYDSDGVKVFVSENAANILYVSTSRRLKSTRPSIRFWRENQYYLLDVTRLSSPLRLEWEEGALVVPPPAVSAWKLGMVADNWWEEGSVAVHIEEDAVGHPALLKAMLEPRIPKS